MSGSNNVNASIPSYVVGIGASAGGLNALEQFFANMPTDSGMAFVVIQHLSPDFKSLMDDLLARHTTMPIHRVTNGIELQADSVYLIPPKTHMTVKEGRLYLTEKPSTLHVDLPIDIFLRSLAEASLDKGIAIILSGTGSDGSRGLQSIHEAGGLVLVQTPESAQFDGMPKSAIATGMANYILPPDRMPRVLLEYAANPEAVRTRANEDLEVFEDEGDYAQIFAHLRRSFNLDFSKYKVTTVGRRISRRMEFRQIPTVAEYAEVLSCDQNELDLLYKDLLIGVTEFFRDRQTFQFIEKEIIGHLFDSLGHDEDLRVWSAGCATGEEAFSLAIVLLEEAERREYTGKITVFATDVHKSSLETASMGLFDASRLSNVSPERLNRFFKRESLEFYRVNNEVRKLVVFAPHNLLSDPPFTRIDMICCRNLLIYFQPHAQERVISLFHFALKKDGVLFLGSSEGLGSYAGEFNPISNQHKCFKKIRDLKLTLDIGVKFTDKPASTQIISNHSLHSRTQQIERQLLFDYDWLLRKHLPPGVLVNEARQVVHYFGNVTEFLKIEGRVGNDVLQMAHDSLHIALSTTLQRAERGRQRVVTQNVHVLVDGQESLLDIVVDPIPDEKTRTIHYHIAFQGLRPQVTLPRGEDGEAPALASDDYNAVSQYRQHMADIESELQSTRENLQATIEELQTTNEELQATNEELLASNEELQSTNEELHSVNEELYSVNTEFERKNSELKQLNKDHDNLLASTEIGTVFLDREMRIRKFNPAINRFFKLLPQDVGRPIDHIAYNLSDRDVMFDDIRTAIDKGVGFEREVEASDHSWLLNRILPFKTEGGQVDGAVLTFTDVTVVKRAEIAAKLINEQLELKVEEGEENLKAEIERRRVADQRLRESLEKYSAIFATCPVGITICDKNGRIVEANHVSEKLLGLSSDEQMDRKIDSGEWWIIRPDGSPMPSSEYASVVAMRENRLVENVEMGIVKGEEGITWLNVSATPIDLPDFGVAIAYSDITQRKMMEDFLRESELRFRSLVDQAGDGIYIHDLTGRILDCNRKACDELGYGRDELLTLSVKDIDADFSEERDAAAWVRLEEEREITLEEVHRRKDGSTFPVEVHISMLDLQGQKTVIAVARDLSDRKLVEEDRLNLERKFLQAQKLESIGVLAGGVAHDFNNLLMIISGNLEMVTDLSPKDSPVTEHVVEAMRACRRATDLTRQLLAYSGKAPFHMSEVSLDDLVEMNAELLRTSIPRTVSFRVVSNANLPRIKADSGQIQQVVMNLITNAAEAIDPNPGTVTISTGVMECDDKCLAASRVDVKPKPGHFVYLEVKDDGQGMDEDTLARLFEPFFSTKFTGRGLGLSAVQGIIRTHGGALLLESQPGKGSTFRILFPALEAAQEAALVAAEPRPPVRKPLKAPGRTFSGTALVVDDEAAVLKLCLSQIKSLGFNAVGASDGREAVKVFHDVHGRVDLVVLDLMMPHMDGAATLKELRALNPDLKVLVASGYNETDAWDKFKDVVPDGFIQKPFDLKALSAKLEKILGPA